MNFIRPGASLIKSGEQLNPAAVSYVKNQLDVRVGNGCKKIDGRWMARYAGCKNNRTREPDIPLLRGHFYELQKWSPLWFCPEYEHRPVVIHVKCVFCDRDHFHGCPSFLDGRYISKRGAHCPRESEPRWPRGYYISPYRMKDAGYKDHCIRPGQVWIRRRKVVS